MIKVKNKNISVLIAEDEEFNRELYRDTFVERGFEVYEAENGSIALEQAERHKVDIILLDIQMPVMTGIDALKQIKSKPETYGNPLIVMLTSMSTDPVIEESYENKADGYLIKHEVLPDEIVDEVESIYKELRLKDK